MLQKKLMKRGEKIRLKFLSPDNVLSQINLLYMNLLRSNHVIHAHSLYLIAYTIRSISNWSISVIPYNMHILFIYFKIGLLYYS